MNLKTIVAASLLACAGLTQAASVYQGPVTVVDPEFATFAKGSLVGAFDLYWDFKVTGPASLTSSVTSYVNGNKDVDFSSVFLTDGTNTYNYTKTGSDPAEQWALAPVGLVSGVTYEVHTLGSATGRAGFTGELQITAVPEPETYALMLAGLGAVGFVARRRKA